MPRKFLITIVVFAATVLFIISLFTISPVGLMILRLYKYSPGVQTTIVNVSIDNDSMTPSRIKVEQGKSVALRLNSDRRVDFRVAGLLQTSVPARYEVGVQFNAKNAGRYEVWDDRRKERLGMLLVRSRE